MSAARRLLVLAFCLSPLLLAPSISNGQFMQVGKAGQAATAVPVSAPRELRIHLDRAKKALSEKQYVDVCDHINELLKSDTADYFVNNDPDAAGLKEEVAKLALSLTGEARKTYELRFGVEAEGLLDQALKAGEWDKLDWLQFRYIGTKAAVKAALMSARMQMDQGEPAAAAIRLERIASVAREFEPELSLLTASGWLQAGDRSSARNALLRLHRERRPSVIKLGSKETPWFDQESEVDAWMDRWLSPSMPSAAPVPDGDRLKLQLAWRVTSGENSDELDVLTALRDQFNRKGVTALPVLSPLLGGDWIVARSTRRLFGFDPQGGKRVWAYPPRPEEGLEDPLTTTMHEKRKALTAAGEAIFRHTWTDGLYAGIATDGDRRLFLIEGLTAPQPKSRYGVRVAIGRPVRFPFPDPNTNRLVALDLKREGALAWTIGGGDGSANEKLKKAFFISPPVINGGSVLVLAEIEQQIKLFSFTSQSGELEWEQDLLVLSNDKISQNAERRLRGGRLAVKNGMLLCWTGADYMFGYDLAARRFIWKSKLSGAGPNAGSKEGEIETYPLNPRYRISYRNPGNEWAQFSRLANPDDRWTNASLLCAGRYCLITPPNLKTIMCIDLYTGKSIWTKPKRDFLYVACEFDGSILLAGRYRMAMVGLADGRPKWVGALQSLGGPSGHGVRMGRYYYLPTSEGELLSVDMTTGDMVNTTTEHELGNLARIGDLVVSQSPTSFVAFTPQDREKPPAPATAEDEKYESLVRRLGDSQFRVREDAEKRLRDLGGTASSALEAGLSSTDPETRIRCRRLLTRVAKNSRIQLIAAFKKNDPKNPVQLPGWKGFKTVAGDNKESREFFADMYVTEFNLFDQYEKKTRKLTPMLQQRCMQLKTAMSQYQYQLSLPTIATVIYLSTREEAERDANLTNYAVTFCSQNAFRQNIGNAQRGPLLKKLLVGLMNQSAGTTPNYQLINLGMQYDIKECYELARRFLNNRQQSGYAKAYALSAISRYGEKKRDTPVIQKVMSDKMQCSSYTFNGKRYITQVRDVALVSLIELYKQDPKKFDFPRYQKNGHLIAFHTIGFVNDKDRAAAVEKWTKFMKTSQKPGETSKDAKAADGGAKKAVEGQDPDKKEAEGKADEKKGADKKDVAKEDGAKEDGAKEDGAKKGADKEDGAKKDAAAEKEAVKKQAVKQPAKQNAAPLP